MPAAAWAAAGKPARPLMLATASVKAEQQLADYKVSVKRLETGVSKQEAASREATQSLHQQDQKIADLRRQLQLLRAQAPAQQP